MTEIGAFEAKTHLPELLDRVASGEKILITKRGQPVAMLVPPAIEQPRDVKEILAQLKELRRGNKLGGISIRELIEEGRRY
jgi:prevent-host-death family protein